MNRVVRGLGVGLVAVISACASSGGGEYADGLSVTAYSAWGEARSQARGWAADAELQYVEGAAVTNRGTVERDAGYWRFAFGSDSRAQQYVVTVTPTAVTGEERSPQGPPGFALGNATLGSDWLDSPSVVEAIDGFPSETRVQMYLVPTTPPRWIIGDIEIDARTGARL